MPSPGTSRRTRVFAPPSSPSPGSTSGPTSTCSTARLERATRLAPRFRQRLLEPPGRLAAPRWIDADFDLSLHLHRIDSPLPAHSRPPSLDFVRIEAMTGFDRSRPLWEFTLVETPAGDRAAFVMKVHHSLTDGIGGMQLATSCCSTDRETPPRTGGARPRPDRAPVTTELVRDVAGLRWAPRHRDDSPRTLPCPPDTMHIARNPLPLDVRHSGDRPLGRSVRRAGLRHPFPDHDRPEPRPAPRHDRRRSSRSEEGGEIGGRHAQRCLRFLSQRWATSLPRAARCRGPGDSGSPCRSQSARRMIPSWGQSDHTRTVQGAGRDLVDAAERVRVTGKQCRVAGDDRAKPLSNVIAGTLNLLPSVWSAACSSTSTSWPAT